MIVATGAVVAIVGGMIGAKVVEKGGTIGANVRTGTKTGVEVIGTIGIIGVGIGAVVSGLLFSLHRLYTGICACGGNVGDIFPLLFPTIDGRFVDITGAGEDVVLVLLLLLFIFLPFPYAEGKFVTGCTAGSGVAVDVEKKVG